VIMGLNGYGIENRSVVLVISLGISLAIASALWFAVEKPCAGLRRRFTSLGPRAVPMQPAAASIEPAP
jgi:peptidoglycan/LPS O-acetylase OafA/YrhL